MLQFRSILRQPPVSFLESCTTMQEFKQIHALMVTNGLLNEPPCVGKIISICALSEFGNLSYSVKILTQFENPTIFTLNTLIRAFSKSPTPEQAFTFYNQILRSQLRPDNYTFTFLVRTCALLSARDVGLAIHAGTVKNGFKLDVHVQSGLIHMYAELGCLNSARQVFDKILEPDLVSQTAMVGAYASLGELGLARQLFDKMLQRDLVAWNSMVAGYSQSGQSKEALDLFNLMQSEDIRVNEATMVPVLSACAQLGALDQGKWVHVFIEKNKLKLSVTLGSALIDMYSKCGNLARAMEVFSRMKDKNVFTWSSMMSGLAMHGAGEKCLELFTLMLDSDVSPNGVTFIAVLRACSIVGLVEKGREHFQSMTRVFGIEPMLEHYGCMVDLYGRAGRLADAIDFINQMPVKPHSGAWGALLNACRIHKNIELGELALAKIVELEAKNDGAYVLLSNIYADAKDWNGVSNVRKLMRINGVRKVPGCSVIEVNGEVHEFTVGDRTHPKYREIELMLREISRKLRLAGYVANTNNVLFDIDEEEKEDALSWHSEKVAIAFGLISLGEEMEIRVVMNLRVCGDCHDAAKFISRVFNREIVLRDKNRFHHFRDGECSCMGYW